jgi:hypothetical protein
VREETLSIESYINGLSLSQMPRPSGRIVAKGGGRPAGPVVREAAQEPAAQLPPLPEKLAAAVDAGSILSFVDTVDARERSDILFSVQFAQRAADSTCDRFAESRAWYGKYNEILEAVGWVTEQHAFDARRPASRFLRAPGVAGCPSGCCE